MFEMVSESIPSRRPASTDYFFTKQHRAYRFTTNKECKWLQRWTISWLFMMTTTMTSITITAVIYCHGQVTGSNVEKIKMKKSSYKINNSSPVYSASSDYWHCRVLHGPRLQVMVPHDRHQTSLVDETFHPNTPHNRIFKSMEQYINFGLQYINSRYSSEYKNSLSIQMIQSCPHVGHH